MIGNLVMIADVLARAGDTELYTYSTSDGLNFGPSTPTTDGPKSLELVAMRGCDYVTLRALILECTRGNGVETVGGHHNLVAGCTRLTWAFVFPDQPWR